MDVNIKIYDSKQKKKVSLETIETGKVSLYVCGPTVYDLAHLGHGRSAVAFDVIRRYLEFRGFDVTFVSNYTDIDDKMITRAADEGITVAELADRIIPEYDQDYGDLGIKPADVVPKATDHVEEMIDVIKKLEANGFVYVLDDGVYFDIDKSERYGELSGQRLEDLKLGARIDVKDDKRNPYDFVLWKFKKEGEPSWESPWGEGRPGWHIECSAMSEKHLGASFDIHGGGRDLIFPHHECEMAQSWGANGQDTFAKYWMHNGFINVDNEKMSKSLNNFFTLRDIFKKYDPQIVRFMFLQTQYRNPINFSDVLLEQAKSGLERIHGFIRRLESFAGGDELLDLSKYEDGFISSMDNDFDTSGALGSLFDLIKFVNTQMDSSASFAVAPVLELLKSLDGVLKVLFVVKVESVDDDVEELIKERTKARANKDFATSDRIRDELKERGIELDDTASGTVWKKI